MTVDCVGVQPLDHNNRMFHLSTHDFNASSSCQQSVSISILKRTGQARFRRGPSPSFSTDTHEPSTSSVVRNGPVTDTTSASSGSTSSSSMVSSLGIVAPAPTFSSRKPPLPSTRRKGCSADRPVASLNRSGSGCHCCKRRKMGSKCEIRRVPIIGSKVRSIPADDYSWKKYGEKKIDGLLYPRVYYKCSTGKRCPARKCVELTKDDSKMLLVTYDGEHRHRVAPAPVPEGLTGVVV